MNIQGLRFESKSVHLAAALDFHVALMTVRERVPPPECLDASSIESVFLGVSDEQGLHVERDMGIRVSMTINTNFFTKTALYVSFKSLQEVMSLWEQTQKRLYVCRIGQRRRPPMGHLFRTYDPDTLREIWLSERDKWGQH